MVWKFVLEGSLRCGRLLPIVLEFFGFRKLFVCFRLFPGRLRGR